MVYPPPKHLGGPEPKKRRNCWGAKNSNPFVGGPYYLGGPFTADQVWGLYRKGLREILGKTLYATLP